MRLGTCQSLHRRFTGGVEREQENAETGKKGDIKHISRSWVFTVRAKHG